MSNLLAMRGDIARSSTGDKKLSGEVEDVISVASLEVSINHHGSGRPALYDVVYSRGGWWVRFTWSFFEVQRSPNGPRDLC